MKNYELKKYLKFILLINALLIAGASLYYTNQLVRQLEKEERIKAKTWANAYKEVLFADDEADLTFPLSIVQSNRTIPVIVTDHNGEITNFVNLDSNLIHDSVYLKSRLRMMQEANEPIEVEYLEGLKNRTYYENSIILTKLKLFPWVQLSLIGVFLGVSYMAFSYSRRSEQNQVWVGMSKETAHQLGTPISSLVAWMEVIGETKEVDDEIHTELQKDVDRLQLIAERFSKIGSKPDVEQNDITQVFKRSFSYMQSRTSNKVKFNLNYPNEVLNVNINEPLFAWVIENLIKNAIDAMNGVGEISVDIKKRLNDVTIDIKDTGKGIPKSNHKTIFKPGYTTKKRGWGLGLSLVKRIVENYHQGQIFVRESHPGEGTTFRIVFKRVD